METATATATMTTPGNFSSWIPRSNVYPNSVKFGAPLLVRTISLKLSAATHRTNRRNSFWVFSEAHGTAVAAKETEEYEENNRDDDVNRRKLYVANLPWDYSATDLQNLFGQFGHVHDVEIIKQKNGKSRGFAFVAMSSPEEAQVAIDKLDSFELLGRIIRVELAKSFTKPYSTLAPTNSTNGETRNWIYVSNLAWKVRSVNLREFFADKFKPVSARVVFDGSSGRSAGYGFVSFATNEEVVAAISELDGKLSTIMPTEPKCHLFY
ncbi:28 kDa ribonucleoprotein, chloroplastic isoform X2 [Dendrobium catenatum]|uniref:28 kDa ribonucleoprotein, chloroplastic n=1 Tax=Dendrobium catenatum TaxID=906689 RepID=A0A2I0W6V1_9ASPA|nr:28 kDa ribonucleoprotein, chloroplastic isoform X2 [Dendrobium catenatum]PKU71381.1 28 kDa ribonucleoprotein, chloroplastic [Dendrobium catenatum]